MKSFFRKHQLFEKRRPLIKAFKESFYFLSSLSGFNSENMQVLQ